MRSSVFHNYSNKRRLRVSTAFFGWISKKAPHPNKRRNKIQTKPIAVSIVLVNFNRMCNAYITNKQVNKCLLYYFISFGKCLHSLKCVAVKNVCIGFSFHSALRH